MPNFLFSQIKYYKENVKGVTKMCQIVEEYAQEKVDFQKARDIIEHIDTLMETCKMTLQQACGALKITEKNYEDAKKLLSGKETIV